ncbi:MAG: hypothetical protein V4719_26475 [Planctomycetota bacterium]
MSTESTFSIPADGFNDRDVADTERIKAEAAFLTAHTKILNMSLERNAIATQVHTAKLECTPIAITTGFNLPVALVCGTALAISGRGVLGWSLILMVICLDHLPRFIRECYPAKT